MSIGIKETKEVLTGLEALGVTAGETLKDGFQIKDIGELIKLFGPLKDALVGIDQVDDELKDLDKDELTELGIKAYEMITKIVEAWKK